MNFSFQVARLNLAVALDRLGGDEELLREVARLFLDEYPQLMQDILKAGKQRDAVSLQHAAHSLKGSVGNFGAPAAYEAAYALESAGRTGDLGQVDAQVAHLMRTMAEIHPELVELASAK